MKCTSYLPPIRVGLLHEDEPFSFVDTDALVTVVVDVAVQHRHRTLTPFPVIHSGHHLQQQPSNNQNLATCFSHSSRRPQLKSSPYWILNNWTNGSVYVHQKWSSIGSGNSISMQQYISVAMKRNCIQPVWQWRSNLLPTIGLIQPSNHLKQLPVANTTTITTAIQI